MKNHTRISLADHHLCATQFITFIVIHESIFYSNLLLIFHYHILTLYYCISCRCLFIWKLSQFTIHSKVTIEENELRFKIRTPTKQECIDNAWYKVKGNSHNLEGTKTKNIKGQWRNQYSHLVGLLRKETYIYPTKSK